MDGKTLTSAALALATFVLVAPWAPSAPAKSSADAVIRGRVTLAQGRVTFAGSPPAGETLDMSADPYCREQHEQPVVERPVRVDESGGLADVLVHVRNAPANGGAAAEPEVLDQVGCLYTPGVVALRTGQTLTIRNSDETLHNVRVTPEINRGFNLGQPLKGIESRRSFSEREVGIPVRCDIHGWM
ncbi:MAG: hypothetical protein R3266_05890, partial [Gemmatimonadota bacterium]|nr:hypothetical protein [Gemmatimonadota bacterium]